VIPRTLATAGRVNADLLPRGPNGRALCRYCGREVPEGRRTFCGGDKARFVYRHGTYLKEGSGCVHEHCVRSQPAYARQCCWARDQGRCALCPAVAGHHSGWEADHIVPVVEGGGSCGLENLRTLCTTCHRLETAKLAARRAERRRISGPSAPPA
jgi:5-methylcytosine-specific restriction endonuclease McrA